MNVRPATTSRIHGGRSNARRLLTTADWPGAIPRSTDRDSHPSLSILTVAGVGRLALACRRESGVVAGRTFISRSVSVGTDPLRSPRLDH